MSSSANKTVATDSSVDDFLAGVDARKRADSYALIEMMRDISGHEPVMWGPSIIGFGIHHYKYDSGREGDVGAIGFSPRKANLTIYFNDGFEDYGDLLARLGVYKTSVACLYIKSLADVDISVLKEMVSRSYYRATGVRPKPLTVDEYEAAVPDQAKATFRELRKLTIQILPQAEEIISYAIPAYRVGKGRPVVYISGWRDHVAVYPIPLADEALQKEMKPYIKGKGTLWFALDTPLPAGLIEKVIIAHLEASEQRRK